MAIERAGASRTGGGPKGKNKRMTGQEDEERRKKYKEDEKMDEVQQKWLDSMKERGFTCERQVDKPSLRGNNYINLLENKGLTHFFMPVKGYVKDWVVEFYTNMRVDAENERIESKVGSKTIVLTPSHIAKYLNYERPDHYSRTYPRCSSEFINPYVVRDVAFYDYDTNRGSGGLKDGYRTMNKVIHYNLYPRGTEKRPNDRELELLYVFMKTDEVMDYALWIFDQLVEFKNDTMMKANFPFVAMITEFCVKAGLKPNSTTLKYEVGPGVINASTENRSWANSKRPLRSQAPPQNPSQAATDTPSSSTPTQKGGKSIILKILKSILFRQVEIQEDQKRINRKVDYLVDRVGEFTGKRYISEDGPLSSHGIGEHVSPDSSVDDGSGVPLAEEEIDPGMLYRGGDD